MKKMTLAVMLVLLSATAAFALGAYINPVIIDITQGVRNNIINPVSYWIEVKNVNAETVRVHFASAPYIDFDDNDFDLQPGELRRVNFTAIITKWGGYDTFIDVTYRRLTGGIPAMLSSTVHINAQSLGNAINTHPPFKPVIISPISGSTIAETTTFEWMASLDPDPENTVIQYFLIIDDDSDFSSPVINASTIGTQRTVHLDPGYAYYWRVVAFDGKHSVASDSGSGQTHNDFPPVPALVSPPTSVVLSVEPTLTWTAVIDPDGTPVKYDVMIDNNPDFGSPEVFAESLSEASYNTKGKLNEGIYYWRVRSRDNIGTAGWSAVRLFTLQCDDPYCYNLQLFSPLPGTYNDRSFTLEFEISKNAKYVYRALNSNVFTMVCKDCSAASKSYTGKEGLNNLTLKIVGYNGEQLIRSFYFTADTTKPRVVKTEPKDNSWIGGTLFTVKYTEVDVSNISLFYGPNAENEVLLSNCPSGTNVECSIDLDVSAYHGQDIIYYFVIRDLFSAAQSKTYDLHVDSVPPVLDVDAPLPFSIFDTTSVRIIAFVDEEVTLDYQDNGGKWTKLCSKCDHYNSTKTFKDGAHQLLVRATDLAGNQAIHVVSFEVDSKAPRISRTEPSNNGYANGFFKVRYTEESVEGVSLFYGPNAENELPLVCPSGSNVECSVNVPLGAWNGQQIDYYFMVEDHFTSDTSSVYTINVDTTAPVLALTNPVAGAYASKMVPIAATVSEKVTLEYRDNGSSWKSLCSNCASYSGTRYLYSGHHVFDVRATDKAGNSDTETVSFDVA